MKLLEFLRGKKHQNINFIKDNNLEDWWNKSFSDRERKMIISESSNLLNNNLNSDKTAARTLYLLAGNAVTKFYNKKPDVIIRLLKKAAELSEDSMELFEIYSQLIKLQNENGKKKEALNLIKQAKEENWDGNWDQLLSQIN